MQNVHDLPETITNPADLNFTGATGSYSGKARRCCCGCSGNHSKNKAAITRQINNIKRLVAEGHPAEAGPNFISVEVVTGHDNNWEPVGRLYIVYFD